MKITAMAGAALTGRPASSAAEHFLFSAADGLPGARRAELAKQILADKTLDDVLEMARNLLKGGLNAGSGYQTTWIRDMNTFLNVAIEVNPPERFRDALLMFCKFQGPTGDIVDCFIKRDPAKLAVNDRTAELAPGYVGSKNSVETDQESSLVQAVAKYIAFTRDRALLDMQVGGVAVIERLGLAVKYVMSERFDARYGLVWGGTTIDWGDVQPEGPRGVVPDASSHRAFSIYDNAMLMIALNDYIALIGDGHRDVARWKEAREQLRHAIRKHLWDAKREKFIPHVYIHGSPFPEDFDENAIYYHGGTAVAIEAGLLSHAEARHAEARMVQDVRQAGASSIGLTIYPPYPLGFFKNPQLTVPYTYQNGGDWCWFGGRMIQQLVKYGFIEEAYRDLRPMVERVKRVGDFHEWWTRDDEPRGSAGVLGQAVEMLQAWAKQEAA
jgi:hypothetical protein